MKTEKKQNMANDSELGKPQSNGTKENEIRKAMGRKRSSLKPLGERHKAVFRQRMMVLLGNIGVLGAGMSVAIPSVTLGQLTDPKEQFRLSTEEASWYSSINAMACPLGGIIVGYLMDRLGRKWTMLITNIFGIIGWGLLCTASLHKTKESIYAQMLIARFFSGIMMGLCISPVGAYSAEISLPKIRGQLILFTSIGLATGILLMYTLGYFIRRDWRLIAFISCIFQVFSTLCVLPLPESPSWLMQRGDDDEARKSLKYFRGLKKRGTEGCEEFQFELAQMRKNTEISRMTAASESSVWSIIKAPEVYRPFLLMVGFFIFQQMTGVVVIVVFAVQIVTNAGVTVDPVLCAVFVGLARFITTFFISGIFERFGRKPAGIVSAGGMAICMLTLAVSGWFFHGATAQILPITCIVLYIVFCTMGLLTLPFFMISEVFPQRVRGAASGTTICCGLLVSFMVVKIFPTMEETFGTPAAFAFFGFSSLCAVFYIFFLIPETRGRTLVEIEEYFRSGKRFSDDGEADNQKRNSTEGKKMLNQ